MNQLYLYRVQDDDRPMYVVAANYAEAVEKWRKFIFEDDPKSYRKISDVEDPKGVQIICDKEDIIL